jgi:hypothetical protein
MRGRIREEEAIRRRGANLQYLRVKEAETGGDWRLVVIVSEGGSLEEQGKRTEGILRMKLREGLSQGTEPQGGNSMDATRFRERVSTKQRRIAEEAGETGPHGARKG